MIQNFQNNICEADYTLRWREFRARRIVDTARWCRWVPRRRSAPCRRWCAWIPAGWRCTCQTVASARRSASSPSSARANCRCTAASRGPSSRSTPCRIETPSPATPRPGRPPRTTGIPASIQFIPTGCYAEYCHGWRSICALVTLVSPAKMAVPIKMLIGVLTRVGRKNYIYTEVHMTPLLKGIQSTGMHCKA